MTSKLKTTTAFNEEPKKANLRWLYNYCSIEGDTEYLTRLPRLIPKIENVSQRSVSVDIVALERLIAVAREAMTAVMQCICSGPCESKCTST